MYYLRLSSLRQALKQEYGSKKKITSRLNNKKKKKKKTGELTTKYHLWLITHPTAQKSPPGLSIFSLYFLKNEKNLIKKSYLSILLSFFSPSVSVWGEALEEPNRCLFFFFHFRFVNKMTSYPNTRGHTLKEKFNIGILFFSSSSTESCTCRRFFLAI